MQAVGAHLERREDRALSYREREAAKAMRLLPTYNEAVQRHREAEADLSWARDQLGTLAAKLLLGEATENEVAEIEREIEDKERAARRWKAAMRQLDEERGVIRDPSGHVL